MHSHGFYLVLRIRYWRDIPFSKGSNHSSGEGTDYCTTCSQ